MWMRKILCVCLIRKGAVGGRLAEGALGVGLWSGGGGCEEGEDSGNEAKFHSVCVCMCFVGVLLMKLKTCP